MFCIVVLKRSYWFSSHQSLPLSITYISPLALRSSIRASKFPVSNCNSSLSESSLRTFSAVYLPIQNLNQELSITNTILQAHTLSNNNMPWMCCKKRDGDCRNPSNPDHVMFCLSCWHRRCDKCPPVPCRMAVRSTSPLATQEANANNVPAIVGSNNFLLLTLALATSTIVAVIMTS